MGEGSLCEVVPTLTAQTGGNIGGGTLAPGQDLAALVAAITAANQEAPASGSVASPGQEVNNTKHMSKNEMATLLQMCRKSSTGTLAYLPAWFQDCADKGTTDPYRQMIVQKYVMANT